MKLLQLICLFCVGWTTDYVSGYHDYHQSPYTGNCGVQLQRTRTGGVYYAYPGTTPISYGTGNSGAASTQHSSSSSLHGNNGYYGSYGNSGSYGSGSGRYPTTGSQYGSGYNNNYQGSSSNAGNYGGSGSGGYNTGNYGTSSSSSSSSSQKNSYGSRGNSQSSGSSGSYDGYSGNSGSSSSSRNYGSGSGWSQSQRNAYEDEQAAAAASSSLLVFAKDVLTAHNSYRARHNTPSVTLDTTMSLKAQEWANEMASGRSSFGHSPEAVEGIYGESLQILNNKYPSGIALMDNWYEEMDNYDYKQPKIVRRPRNERNSHFTAMLWYATRKIGVGKATSPDGKSYVVVSYYPPGNNVDVLENNVFPPKK